MVKVREDLEGLIVKDENDGKNPAGAESLNVVITWGVKKQFQCFDIGRRGGRQYYELIHSFKTNRVQCEG